MPPRARKTPAKKEGPAVTSPVEPTDEPTEETPKARPGRKKSVLAEAAREFEHAARAVNVLEQRYAKQAEALSDTTAKLDSAREMRDAMKAVLDSALNG